MEQAGAIIVVFGLLIVGRGLWDRLRSGQVAAANRRRRESTGIGWFQRRKTFDELRNPPPVHGITVHRQAERVLQFGGAVVALGLLVLILA